MKHQTEIYDGEPLNFEMVYRRYLKFSSQNSTVQNVERPVVLKAFEHLKVRPFWHFPIASHIFGNISQFCEFSV
jgi:origin recognition complex subunit 4